MVGSMSSALKALFTREPASDETMRTLSWTLFAAFCLHNAEEALTMQASRGRLVALLAKLSHVAGPRALPASDDFYVALIAVTVLGAAITWMVTRGESKAWQSYLLAAFAATILLNVFIPHVPASLLALGYTPGVASALLINLPLCTLLLRRLLRDRRISKVGLSALLLAAPLTMQGSLWLGFALAGSLR